MKIAIIIILAIIFIVIFYVYYHKKQSIISNSQNTQEFLNFTETKNTLEKANIFDILNFQKNILFLEAKANNNAVFFDIKDDVPQVFESKIFTVLALVNSFCKFLIFEAQNALIKIEILNSKIINNSVLLDINIISDKEISQNKITFIKQFFENKIYFDDKFITQAKKYIDELKVTPNIFFDNPNTGFNFTANLMFFNCEKKQLPNKFDFKVLISEENEIIFDDLSAKFTNLGCEVKPNLKWHTIQAHIDNFVYKPDIVIFDAEILQIPQNIKYLNENWSKKDIYFVILEKNGQYSNLSKQLNFKTYKLTMPYFFEDIIALCFVLDKNKLGSSKAKA